ncbi:LOW QUALITY PROTEIN: hypothetical protein HID58_015733 [Brassica napus]|uniref:Uncharacterized protein n=1 Tax=Brassica napus TaxID=3708 RepID=A0ABQ8DNH4_BRANA|nr:LOW QUALITY PROTEIN: hypothetical protein HID58_015733 [Brassica napus]
MRKICQIEQKTRHLIFTKSTMRSSHRSCYTETIHPEAFYLLSNVCSHTLWLNESVDYLLRFSVTTSWARHGNVEFRVLDPIKPSALSSNLISPSASLEVKLELEIHLVYSHQIKRQTGLSSFNVVYGSGASHLKFLPINIPTSSYRCFNVIFDYQLFFRTIAMGTKVKLLFGFLHFAERDSSLYASFYRRAGLRDFLLQFRLCGSPIPFLVTRTTVQDCGFARSVRYHVTIASPSYYAVSSIDGSSQSQPYDLHTVAAIFNGGSRMSCSSRTPTHRVFIGTLRPLFIRARILLGLNDELSTTTHDSVAPLFRVRLVSLSSPLYMARSPSLQTTTLAPQAVVTNFTSRLERFSTFSGKLLESSPRLPQVPVLCYASSNCTALFWVCSLTPMASDSPSLLQGVSMEGQPTPLPPAIQAFSETWFNCSQNPMVGFFKVNFDVGAFLRMQALGLQVKLLFRYLLSLATSIFHLVLVIFVYQLTVEDHSGCNGFGPLGF